MSLLWKWKAREKEILEAFSTRFKISPTLTWRADSSSAFATTTPLSLCSLILDLTPPPCPHGHHQTYLLFPSHIHYIASSPLFFLFFLKLLPLFFLLLSKLTNLILYFKSIFDCKNIQIQLISTNFVFNF